MPDERKPLKKGDKVYIKPWEIYGEVTHARPADTPEDEIYRASAEKFFNRSDLTPDTRQQEAEEKRIRRKQKQETMERLAAEVRAKGHSADPKLVIQAAEALSDLWVELGHPPFIVPINDPHKK
jgi:hypothetical protein